MSDTTPARQRVPWSRRLVTLTVGVIPVTLLAAALSIPRIPGTDIALTVPFAAEGPGPIFDTLGEVNGEEVVEVSGPEAKKLNETGGREGANSSGELNMTTVAVRTNLTLAQALGRWLFTEDNLIPIDQIIPKGVDPDEVAEANRSAFVESESAATLAAMNHLGLPTEVTVAEVIEDSAAQGLIDVGDVILGVNGHPTGIPLAVAEIVREHAPGELITLKIRRGTEELDIPLTLGTSPVDEKVGTVGVLMKSEPAGELKVDYNLQDVGGPSAGMIFSLAVIDKLTPGELTGGAKVAGTGTINPDGRVGPIGGIAHKVSASADEGAELFLAPRQNCKEALRGDVQDMAIAAVDDLNSAIAAMEAFAAGQPFERCGD